MKKAEILREVMRQADEKIEEFFNLNELPAVPNFAELQEDIANSLPDEIDGEDFNSYMSTATVFMLKKAMNRFASYDNEAFNRAFAGATSLETNNEASARLEKVLEEAEDETLEEDE